MPQQAFNLDPIDQYRHPPLVSIISPFLNGEIFLAEAIESVLRQTLGNWELLLVDDGSTDASTAISKDFAAQYPGRVRYFEHPGHANFGISASRNLGIRHARGKYIAFIDADDVWRPSKLAEQASILEENPDLGLVCGAVNYWSDWNGGTNQLVLTGHIQNKVVLPPEAALRVYPLGTATSPCPSDVLVPLRTIERIAGFEEHFTGPKQLYEDQAFFMKLYLASPAYFSSKVWLNYRLHSDSCMAVVMRSGQYHEVRKYFLNWLETYLANLPSVDPRITKALNRALRPYRSPRRDFILRFPSRLYNSYYLRILLDQTIRRIL